MPQPLLGWWALHVAFGVMRPGFRRMKEIFAPAGEAPLPMIQFLAALECLRMLFPRWRMAGLPALLLCQRSLGAAYQWRALLGCLLALLCLPVSDLKAWSAETIPMERSDYRIGPGDRLRVEDANLGALSGETLRVSADGTVDLPLVGTISLLGLTQEAAQSLLNQRYQTYYVTPAIQLQVLSQHPIRVYVKGAVTAPGVYISGKNTRPDALDNAQLGSTDHTFPYYRFYLTDALLQAGGLQPNADARHIRLYRQSGMVGDEVSKSSAVNVDSLEMIGASAVIQEIDLMALLKDGEKAVDIPLEEGDMLEVPSLPPEALAEAHDWQTVSQSNLGVSSFSVSVIGAVRQPGSYALQSGDTVLTAIALAGGLQETANPQQVYLLRTNHAGQVFKERLSLDDSRLKDAHRTVWPALQPEDVIFVDMSKMRQAFGVGRTTLNHAAGSAILPLFNSVLRRY